MKKILLFYCISQGDILLLCMEGDVKKMKACIFDLDGTLTDTLESLAYSVKATLREMGLSEITDEQCKSFVGNGARYLIDHAIRAAGDPEGKRIEEGMEVYGRIFDANCTYRVTPYEGIPEALKAMKDSGLKLAVLSNKPHRQTVKVVKEIFGEGVFDYVSGQQEGIRRKPEPDGIWKIVETLGVNREDCLYVGDSEVDALTGRNAGVKTVCVSWGFRTKEELKAAEAEYIIDKAEELLEFV